MNILSDIYKYKSSTGLLIPDIDTIRDLIVTDIKENVFKEDIDVTMETPIGRLIEWFALVLYQCVCMGAEVANQTNINYATGKFLDGLCSLYNIQRKGETFTSVLATLTGTSGSVIPVGSLARTDEDNVFASAEDVTIGADGTARVEFVATVAGPIPCDTGSLNKIDTAVVGWDSITNEGAGVLGYETEPDADLRERILLSRSFGKSFISAIYNAVGSVDGVDSVAVYENGDSNPHDVNGVTLKGHSIFVCVKGGTDSDVARAIYNHKSAGCGYTNEGVTGATLKNITVEDENTGTTYQVQFYRPSEISTTKVTVQITNNRYLGSDFTDNVKDEVTKYLNSRKIGEDVYSAQLSLHLQSLFPQCTIVSVGFSSAGNLTKETVHGFQKILVDNNATTVSIF